MARRSASPRRRRVVLTLVGLVIAGFIFLPWIAGVAVDWWWFQEVGFQTVFTREWTTRGILFLVTAIAVYAFFHANIALAQRGPVLQPVVLMSRVGGEPIDLVRIAGRALKPIAIAFSFLFAISASAMWLTFLKAFNAASVGATDPVFGRDIGYYMFSWPAISAVLGMASGVLLITLLMLAVLYWVRGELVLPPRRASIERTAAIHLGVLLAAQFVLVAVRLIVVDLPQILYATTGPLVGASYTDIHARIPGYYISAVVALAAAAFVLYGVARNKLIWHATLAVIVYVGISVLARGVYPFAVQKLVVAPNELNKETPYLRNHIDATRRAWGLDRLEIRNLSGEANLSLADIRRNGPTIENVRLWERDLLQQTFGQLQEIRTYYDFVNVDDDRYVIDGRYRQIHLSARELNTQSLPTRTFINERLTFTHGMGITLAPVNQVTSEGLPVLFIKDLPPASTVSLKVTRPAIYFGELTTGWVAVNTSQPEFDYPAGDQNTFTKYTGRGGVAVSSVLRRVMFALHLGSLKAFLSDDIRGQSRMMYNRAVGPRAQKALPFLDFDGDPYLVVDDGGRLRWILDAYTRSELYPYSRPVRGGTTYMRNSVKVVIDAYDGTVDAYVADPADAVLRTYAAAFPGIFKDIETMPPDLRRHLRYPTDLFAAQSTIYQTYHMLEPRMFYHREDQWQIPVVGQRDRDQTNPFMRHIIMRLPGEAAPEFIYMTPYTPRGKDNLAAWLAARNDGEHYGKLIVYRFPNQSLIYGPRQVVNRINQDTEISRQITLWDQRGSEVIRGELLVIPIEESLLYVQPLYLRAEGGTIPELKRVVIAHQNRVVMAETFEQGLGVLFGGAPPPPVDAGPQASAVETPAEPRQAVPAPAGAAALAQQARTHYDRAVAAQRAGDWAAYGREIEQLGAVLRRLSAQR